MGQRSEKLQDLPLEQVKAHPEIITDLLSDDGNVSVVLEKRGDMVRFAAMRRYGSEDRRILEKARVNYARKESQGYTREDAFADLQSVQEEFRKIQQSE